MAPAPPPPPANLPNFSAATVNVKPPGLPKTSALLKSIEKGTKLKKTVTNDRSAPLVSNQKNLDASKKSITQNSTNISSDSKPKNSAGLGGLFANGFPALRSAKQASEKDYISSPKVPSEVTPKFSKKPANDFTVHLTEAISRDPERALKVAKKGTQLAAPVIISEVNNQIEKKGTTSEISKSVRELTSKIYINPSTESISDKENPGKWNFPIERDTDLPKPIKFKGCKKIYMTKAAKASDKFSRIEIGAEVTESDIRGFIKTLKSKINKAASEENFEECVRLKSKLKSFEVIEKRIQSGEQISSAELPK